MSKVWTQLGSEAACPGAGAYAQKKAGMYADLCDTCKSVYASTKDALKDNGIGLDWIGLDGIGLVESESQSCIEWDCMVLE